MPPFKFWFFISLLRLPASITICVFVLGHQGILVFGKDSMGMWLSNV